MDTAVGLKGSDVYTVSGAGDKLVSLSALLVRGVSPQVIGQAMKEFLHTNPSSKAIENLFVLAFQNRDIRGGKGERDIFRDMFSVLLSEQQTTTVALDLLDLVSEYGCWQDLFKLQTVYPYATDRIKQIIKTQFEKDEAALAAFTANPLLPPAALKLSLLAKWMPREGQAAHTEMAGLLVPGKFFHATRMKHYRKRVAALNKALRTVEISMCAKMWANIDPAVVPGRASKKYVKAYLNEKWTTKKGEAPPYPGTLRYPDDPDRMMCREHFQQHFARTASGEVKAKGADTLFPHEIVKKAVSIGLQQCETCSVDYTYCKCEANLAERNHLLGVWRSMVEAAKAGGGLGRSLAMCDFSGSMATSGKNRDLPYWVSMALGLLISELTTDEFKNTFLTFDSEPLLHKLPEGDLFERISSFLGSSITIGQGLSTDFQKAMDLVLQQCKAKRVKPGQEPENLIVLTDMGWDRACGSNEDGPYTGNTYRHVVKTGPWQTHVEMIREAFKRAGEDMWGEGQGLTMPTIVIWNLAATCQDFHAKSDTEGVVMLSGWSPSLFKVLQTKGIVQMTPLEALRIQLESPRYDLVRQRCQALASVQA